MKYYYPSPEEEQIAQENYKEKYLLLLDSLKHLFPSVEHFEIWSYRTVFSMPIRRLAMTFKQSRRHVLKKIAEVNINIGNWKP